MAINIIVCQRIQLLVQDFCFGFVLRRDDIMSAGDKARMRLELMFVAAIF